MKNLFLNRKGMTLVEVLIVAAIMGVLAIGFATIFKNAYKTEAHLAAKQASREFRDEIEYGIAGPNCGLPAEFFTTSPLPTIKPSTQEEIDIFSEEKPNIQITGPRGNIIKYGIGYDKLTVMRASIGPFLPGLNMELATDIFLDPVLNVGSAAYKLILPSHPLYSGELRITLKKTSRATAKPNEKDEYIISRHLVILEIDSSGILKSCQSVRHIADAKYLCETTLMNGAGGTWCGRENYEKDCQDMDPPPSLLTCNHEVTSGGGSPCDPPDPLSSCGTTPLSKLK